jgi:hypothetical protein
MPAHRTHRGKERKGWRFPVSESERLEAMARETARMSYPSSMSRGRRPLVKAGTKKAVEGFFVNCSLLHRRGYADSIRTPRAQAFVGMALRFLRWGGHPDQVAF